MLNGRARSDPPSTYFQFLKFVVVGTVNTAFGYGLYVVFVACGFHYSIAALFGTVLGTLFNFATTGRIVFGNKKIYLIWRFIAVYAIIYSINVVGLSVLIARNIGKEAAGAILIFPMAILSFFLNKQLVFGMSQSEQSKRVVPTEIE